MNTTIKLMIAVMEGNHKVAARALAAGAQVDCRGGKGETPLHLAANEKHVKCVK